MPQRPGDIEEFTVTDLAGKTYPVKVRILGVAGTPPEAPRPAENATTGAETRPDTPKPTKPAG